MSDILTPDDIKFLQELAHEIKTQDNACTAKPIYFSIEQEDREWGIDRECADGMAVIDADGEDFTDSKELIEWLIKNYTVTEEQVEELSELDDLEDIYDYCEHNKIGNLFAYTGYRNIEKHDGMFLTRKALKQHLDANYYHYKKNAHSYAHCAWRNPEFKRLLEIVEKFDCDNTEDKS
jgi:hypothetical protein